MKIGVDGVSTVWRGAEPGAGVEDREARAGVPGALRLWTGETASAAINQDRRRRRTHVRLDERSSSESSHERKLREQVSEPPTNRSERNSPRQP